MCPFLIDSGEWEKIIFRVDGEGNEFNIDAMAPAYPNKQLHVGGLPQGPLKRDALERLKKNGVFTQNNFYGCLQEMSIETVDGYNNRQV